MERFLPYLEDYLHYGPYNGIDNVKEWIETLERYLAVIDALQRCANHLPSYKYVSFENRDSYEMLRDSMLLYYGPNPDFQGGPPPDGLPRYHK